jgi:methylenetetrahydrofolate reductase (NADPH)
MGDAGAFEKLLAGGHFAVTADLSPPDSADPEEVYSRARVFDGYVDAITATDSPGANCHMSSVAVCALLERRGYTTVMQISGRDRNRLAVQGDVLGASALGVTNMLCLSGDDVCMGDHPDAKPVLDLDSLAVIAALRTLRDDACFLSGRAITTPPRVFIGSATNPFAGTVDEAVERLERKIAAGAAFVQTRNCYDIPRLREYMGRVRERGLHDACAILVGVSPLDSYNGALRIREKVPGMCIPEPVIDRLRDAGRPKLEGRRLCMELIQQIRDIDGVAGVHVTAYRQEEAVAEIIDASGVLAGRTPWNPAGQPELQLQRAIP